MSVRELGNVLEDLAGPQRGIDVDRVRERVATRRRRRNARRALVAIAVVGVMAMVAGVLIGARGDESNQLDVVTPPPAAPSTQLVYVDSQGLAAYETATGRTRRLDVGAISGWCDTCAIARVGDGIVFVANRHAYWLPSLDGRANDLGDADSVFEAAEGGSVWLSYGGSARRIAVVDGTELQRAPLPDGASLAPTYRSGGAVLPEGVLMRVPDEPNRVGQLRLSDPRLGTTTPNGSSVWVVTWKTGDDALFIDAATTAGGSLVAWAEAGCDAGAGRCSLHLSNVTKGTDEQVPLPEGASSYLSGGRFSPDGTTLAAFASVEPTKGVNPAASLVMIDLTTRQPTVVPGSEVPVGEPVVAASWSPDGDQLFFTGLGSSAKSYRPADRRVTDLPPLTYSFTAVSTRPTPRTTPSAAPTTSPSTSPATPTTATRTTAAPGPTSDPATGDCNTSGGFSVPVIANPTDVAPYRFVLVGEPTFRQWAASEPRCHREAEIQPLAQDQPLVGLLSAHHRDGHLTAAPSSAPFDTTAVATLLRAGHVAGGFDMETLPSKTIGGREVQVFSYRAFDATTVRQAYVVPLDFGVVVISGTDGTTIEDFLAHVDLAPLLGA